MSATAAAPLVGRTGELEALEEFLEVVEAGRGQAMLIEGEPGVGKTRLLAELDEAARDRRLRVISGAAQELESDLPFALLADALHLAPSTADPDRASIGRMLRGDSPEGVEPGQLRYQIVEAILELVERLGEQTPLVVVLDDLHWADPASLAVLDRLLRRLQHAPLGLATAARMYPRSSELDALAAHVEEAGGRRFTLEPLGDDDAVELAARLVDDEPNGHLREAVTATGGNPLFVTELVSASTQEEVIAGMEEAGGRVPSSLSEACRRRLRSLPDDTLAMLRVAAVLGSSFELAALAGVAQRPAAELVEVLDPAISEGALVELDDRLAFRHDLLRDAIYSDLPGTVRDSLHADAARWLGDEGYPAGLVATHLLRGSVSDDEQTIAWLREAAGDAAVGAPGTAVELLEQALELIDRDHPDRDRLRLQLIQTLLWAGRPGEAERRARWLVGEDPGPAEEHAARTMLVYALQAQGRLDDSLAELRAAAGEPSAGGVAQARAWAMWAHAWAHTGDNPQGEEIARQALQSGEEVGDDAAVCLAATALAAMSMFRGERAQAVELGRRAMEIVRERSGPEVAWAQPGFVLARALSMSERHDEAQEVAQEGLRRAEEDGAARGLPLYHGVLGTSAFRRGDWDEATTHLETAVRLAEELDYRFGLIFHLLFLARIAIHRDELEEARRRAEQAEDERPTVEALNAAFAEHAAGLVCLAEGDEEQAGKRLLAAWEHYAPKWTVFNLELGPRLADSLAAAGEQQRAGEMTTEVAGLAERWDTAWARGQATRCRALADDDAEAARRGVELLEQGPPHCLAGGLEETARLLLDGDGSGARDEAVDLLLRARSVWEELGARRGVHRTRARLRALGVHEGVEGSRDRPDSGWAALTDTEWRVAELVAEGLIYRRIGERMFISRRTVETHVSHIFDKLGLSSRAELATAYLREHGD